MKKRYSAVFEMAPEVDGLVASAIRHIGSRQEWSYYHPDDCTVDGRHIRVSFAPDRPFGSRIKVLEQSQQMREGLGMFEDVPSIKSLIKSVKRNRDIYLSKPRHLYGSEKERDAARLLLEAGFQHPGIFRHTWTMPTDDPSILFYIRKPLGNEESGSNQFILTESNGPVTREGWVEAGATHVSGTYRVVTYATSLEEGIDIVHAGEVQPQPPRGMPDPTEPRWLPMATRRWAREQKEGNADAPHVGRRP